jgi:hypothetical protein
MSGLRLVAEIAGLMKTRVELTGPGAFSVCETTEEILDLLLDEIDPREALEMIDKFKSEIEARLAARAREVG